jgi:UDP-glucose 4-epimerase
MYAHSHSEKIQKEQLSAFKMRNPDLIVNAAGPTSITDSIVNPEPYLGVPASIAKFLLEAIKTTGHRTRILQISTASVYGECENAPAHEESSLNPLSPYAEGKAIADQLIAQSESDWIILRATSIYSNTLDGRVLGLLRDGLRKSLPITLGGSGKELRDFMHLEDFAAAIYKLVTNNDARRNVFLVGSGTSLQIAKVAQIALTHRDIQNQEFSVSFDNSVRLGDPFAMKVDLSKIFAYGFRPLIQPDLGLSEYFQAN